MGNHDKDFPCILIVDDQVGVRMLLEETFKADKYRVFTVQDGFQALKLIEKESIDVIFIDYKMPGMNGLELIEKLREKKYNGKVILMTAYDEVEEFESLDIDNILVKPFDINKAREVLDRMLDRKIVSLERKDLI